METASPKKTKTVVRKVLVKRPVKKVDPKSEVKASTPLLSDLLAKDKAVAEPKPLAEEKPVAAPADILTAVREKEPETA